MQWQNHIGDIILILIMATVVGSFFFLLLTTPDPLVQYIKEEEEREMGELEFKSGIVEGSIVEKDTLEK